jgi:hypothetical protein
VNTELERMRYEEVMVEPELLPWHLPGMAVEKHRTCSVLAKVHTARL